MNMDTNVIKMKWAMVHMMEYEITANRTVALLLRVRIEIL